VAKKVKKTSKKKASPPKAKTRKAAGKKASPKKKVTRRRKRSALTTKEVEHFKQLLLQKRTEIIGDVNSIEDEALRKSRLDAAGDLSSMPIHMADIGTDNFEQEFALGLMDSERKLLTEINGALIRIEEGTYGICEGTGKPITRTRLQAKPWARYCVKYATMIEQGLIVEGEKLSEDQDLPGEDLDDERDGLEDEGDSEKIDYDELEVLDRLDEEETEDTEKI